MLTKTLQIVCKKHKFYKANWNGEELTFLNTFEETFGRTSFDIGSETYQNIKTVEGKLIDSDIAPFNIYFKI